MAQSRKLICVRLATYENKLEGEFLTTIFTGRSGLLENTTFAFLAPDGKTRLGRAGRGPQMIVEDRGGRGRGQRRGPPRGGPPEMGQGVDEKSAKGLAALMERYAKQYKAKAEIETLPQGLDFRRALNVAACDNQPLVVAYAKSASTHTAMEQRLAKLAWSEDFVGRMQYLVVSKKDELKAVEKLPAHEGIYFLQPDRFGIEAAVLGSAKTGATEKDLDTLFRKSLAKFETFKKETRSHKRAARKEGVESWETEIPVTDPGLPPRGERGGDRGPPR